MLVVGLTGGIGSGKTTVANLFAALGVPIIDTDVLARELSQPDGKAYPEIVKQFGNDLVVTATGDLDRRALRDIVFADEHKRKTLEDILHPMIREEMSRIIQSLSEPYCIIVIPLLFEKKPNPLIQRILVVDTLEDLQISRTQARDNVKQDHVQSIMKTQVARAHRLEKADDIIVNDKNIEDLTAQVKNLHEYYLTLYRSPPLKKEG